MLKMLKTFNVKLIFIAILTDGILICMCSLERVKTQRNLMSMCSLVSRPPKRPSAGRMRAQPKPHDQVNHLGKVILLRRRKTDMRGGRAGKDLLVFHR